MLGTRGVENWKVLGYAGVGADVWLCSKDAVRTWRGPRQGFYAGQIELLVFNPSRLTGPGCRQESIIFCTESRNGAHKRGGCQFKLQQPGVLRAQSCSPGLAWSCGHMSGLPCAPLGLEIRAAERMALQLWICVWGALPGQGACGTV